MVKKKSKTWHRQAKAKGRDAENAVVEFLRTQHGIPAERRRLTGASDCGDIGGWENTVVSVKSLKAITLASIVDELLKQKVNAMRKFGGKAPWGLAIIKRKGKKDVGQWYAVMTVDAAMAVIVGDQILANDKTWGDRGKTHYVGDGCKPPHGVDPAPPTAA